MDAKAPRKRNYCISWLKLRAHQHHLKYREYLIAKGYHHQAARETSRGSIYELRDIQYEQETTHFGSTTSELPLQCATGLQWDSVQSRNEWGDSEQGLLGGRRAELADAIENWALTIASDQEEWIPLASILTDNESWNPTGQSKSADSEVLCATPEFLKTPLPAHWTLGHFKKFNRPRTGMSRLFKTHRHGLHLSKIQLGDSSVNLDIKATQEHEQAQSVLWPIIQGGGDEVQDSGTVRTRFNPRSIYLNTPR